MENIRHLLQHLNSEKIPASQLKSIYDVLYSTQSHIHNFLDASSCEPFDVEKFLAYLFESKAQFKKARKDLRLLVHSDRDRTHIFTQGQCATVLDALKQLNERYDDEREWCNQESLDRVRNHVCNSVHQNAPPQSPVLSAPPSTQPQSASLAISGCTTLTLYHAPPMPNNPSPAVQDSADNQQNQNEVGQSETQRQPIEVVQQEAEVVRQEAEVVQQEAEVVQHDHNTRQTRKRKRQATPPVNSPSTAFATSVLEIIQQHYTEATLQYQFLACPTYKRRKNSKFKPARVDTFQGRTVEEVANIIHSANIEKQGGNSTTFANLFGKGASNTGWKSGCKSAFRDDLTEARRSLILVPPSP